MRFHLALCDESIDESADLVGNISAERCKLYQWKNADFTGMSDYLMRVDWLKMLSVSLTPNPIWNAFCNMMNDAIDQYVPVKYQSQHNTSKQKGVNYPRSI